MKTVHCDICEKKCILSAVDNKACGLYQVKNDHIVERFADRYLVACPLSIETMPMLHYYPRAKFLQISTVGCNLRCPGCISTAIVREMSPESGALQHMGAEEIVTKAIENQCVGIAFLMNDPLASFYSFLKVAILAHEKHLKVGCSSNAYFTDASLEKLLPYLDFINIGFKGFSDLAYRACGAPSIQPVLNNLTTIFKAGIHLEVSCILTQNNQAEIHDLALFITSLSKTIPFHVMRFIPFESCSLAQEPAIRKTESFCRSLKQHLDFIYLFNTPGTEFLHTCCPQCENLIICRQFYGPMGAKVSHLFDIASDPARCPACGCDLNIKGQIAPTAYQEGDFEGGYPFTRALEMVEAMVIAMGVTEKAKVGLAWEKVLQGDHLQKLHQSIQHPHTYIEAVQFFGRLVGVSERAEALAGYLEERLSRVETVLSGVVWKPRVYYAMGKPLFFINGNRMENQLVETAGGVSVNRQLASGGRPGRTMTVADFNRLDPEVIFISAFISNSVEDFLAECLELKIQAKAVRDRKIFTNPFPGWDFGTPRWILGLMYMASVLHPDRCAFNIVAEADTFYRDFYGIPFNAMDTNRSFSKPSRSWRWCDQVQLNTCTPKGINDEPSKIEKIRPHG